MKIVLFAMVLLIFGHLGKMLVDAGLFTRIEAHGMESCRLRAGIAGPEDLEFSPSLGLVFVSSDHRPGKGVTDPPSGAIFAFPPGEGTEAYKVSPELPFPFHPHGIGIFEGARGLRLFAINHRADRSTIEIFDWENQALVHRKTLDDALLITPNDILPLGTEEFFLSHDHGSRSHAWQALEHFTRIGRGYLTRFDGRQFRVVDNGISFANGLALDRGKNLLYVAAMLEKAVRVYDVKGDPRLVKKIPLEAGPDNLQLDEEGNLWIGAHPKILTLKTHSENHDVPAPSLILKVADPAGEHPSVSAPLSDTGEKISAASVALPWKDKLFLGAIYRSTVLECGRPRSD